MERPPQYFKKVYYANQNINISSAYGYADRIPYSDIASDLNETNLVSAYIYGWSPGSCIYQVQCYADGVYVYCTKAVTNGSIYLQFTYKVDGSPMQ